MTPEQEQQTQKLEARIKSQVLRTALLSISNLKPETPDLLEANVTPRMVEYGDDYRIEGFEHLTLAEYLNRQFKGPWSFFRQAPSGTPKATGTGNDIDLDDYIPGKATKEQTAQLKAALRALAAVKG